MKKIVDGWKYDTETADLMFEILENNCYWHIYRNKKLAFFNHIVDMDKSGEIIREDLRPMSKQDIITILITENYVDKYEEIFGEVPEAEGEDYVSPERAEEQLIADEVNHALQTEISIPKETINATENQSIKKEKKFSPTLMGQNVPLKIKLLSVQLIWTCGCGDYENATELIEKGADCRYKNSKALCKAITLQHPRLIELLLNHGASLSDSNYQPFLLAVSILSVDTFKITILKSCDDLPASVLADSLQIAERRNIPELIQLLNKMNNTKE